MYGLKRKVRVLASVWLSFVLTLTGCFGFLGSANAAQITSRSLTLSSSAASATGVGYTFAFTAPTSTTIKSVRIDMCTTASGTCTPSGPTGIPSGLDTTGAAVGTISNIGSGGSWTGTFSTNGRIDLANNSNTGSPSTVSIQITGVTNPSASNSSFYARISTYSAANWTGALDSGVVVASTAGQITVTASVDETLTFTLSSATVALGTLTSSTTGTGTSTMSAATNASSGYAITVNGSTLTAGLNTIPAITAPSTGSTQGTSQFGINLKDNATPNIGADPSGGSGAASGNYASADNYFFTSGNTVASASGPTNTTTYTVSYIGNVSGSQAPGSYSTTLTYIATATF